MERLGPIHGIASRVGVNQAILVEPQRVYFALLKWKRVPLCPLFTFRLLLISILLVKYM